MIYLSKFVAGKRMEMTYTSTDFDSDQSQTYTLLVRAEPDAYTLAIVDKHDRLKLIATYHPTAVEQPILELLALDFASVKFAIPSSGYAFIPEEAFEEENLTAYLQYLPDDGLVDIAVSKMDNLNIRMIHQTDKLDTAIFAARFPNRVTYPAMQVLLTNVAREGLAGDRPLLVLDKQGTLLYVVFFNQGKLIYAGDFKVSEDSDVNYYLLSVLAHLNLENLRPSLLLSGDLSAADSVYRSAKAHGSEIRFADIASLTGIVLPDELQPSQHQFLTLLGLHRCGS